LDARNKAIRAHETMDEGKRIAGHALKECTTEESAKEPMCIGIHVGFTALELLRGRRKGEEPEVVIGMVSLCADE
jgi:hypothetical protein